MKTIEELGVSPAPWTADSGPMVSMVYEGKPLQECASVCALGGDARREDARLIAAAPDLYEALRKIVSNNECGLMCNLCAVTDRCEIYPGVKALEKAGGAE